MGGDPLVKAAMAQQQKAADAQRQQKMQRVDPKDMQIFQALQAEPNHPKAKAHLERLRRKYGNIF
jgi:hypothetical protein